MFKELKIKIVISDRWGNLSREAKTARKKIYQIEILDMKSTISGIKNLLNALNFP